MIRSRCFRRRSGVPPGGFTLVEMLVSVTILAILAAFVFGAMSAAETTAKTAKTRATVAKLHRLIMARYESYQTRRLPIDFSTVSLQPTQMAMVRLYAIREIMRQEMPEQLSDITSNPEGSPISYAGQRFTISGTSIWRAYYEYYQQMVSDRRAPNNSVTSAEMLYLIVTLSCPGGREQFAENEIGDTDNDGWREFVDGWGRPIYFFRWAPKFIPQYGADTLLQSGNATRQHDPFDPQNVQTEAYQLIPLIYSAGPDGDSGLLAENASTYRSRIISAGQRNPYNLDSGRPTGRKHYDNIHNHRLEVR